MPRAPMAAPNPTHQLTNRLRPNPARFTTTAAFTNAGSQIRTAAFSTKTPIQRKELNWLFQLPFTPAGVKGRGGSGGQTNIPVI